MGLDGVELVMNVEERFGVAISDDDAREMRTVGDLYQFLLSQCTPARTSGCMTSAAFYQVRQGICKILAVNRRDIRPRTRFDELVAPSGYLRVWTRFQQAAPAIRLPNLGRPAWLAHILVHATGFATMFFLASIIFFICAADSLGLLAIPFAILAIAIIALFLLLAEPIATSLPRDFETLGDFLRLVLAKNQAWFLARQVSWSDHGIWEALRSAVASSLGVQLAAVTPEARFVEDLGVG